MSSYLIFTIAYYHIFEDLPRTRSVDFGKDPVQFWYPTLWKHKDPYNFYGVQNAFLSTFMKLVYGPNTLRLSIELLPFWQGRGFLKPLDDFSFIRLYGFTEKLSLLPLYVSDKFFVIEVCKQYKF
jgi:hypothetical protein